MSQCQSGSSGVDTGYVTQNGDFSRTSELLMQHESASIVMRDDMRILLDQKV